MKAHTSEFKENLKKLGRELRGVITYDNTTLEEEINSITPHYEADILKSVMKQLDLELTVDIPLNTVINCQIGILVNNDYEMLNFGNYVVYNSEKQEDTGTYKITCYDKMLYSMKQNEDLNVTYPITIKNYLIALGTKIGLSIENTTFYNQDLQIPSELYLGQEYTYRDILDEIAQATGSVICINDNDKLEVRYPNNLGAEVTATGKNITITEHEDNKISGLKIYGNSEQDGTPTPSSPVIIENAGDSGSINEVISNKNLFKIPITTINGITCTQLEDGAYCFNGTATADSFFKFALTKEIANGTNHVLSCTSNQTSSKVHIRTRNSSNGLADTMVMNVTSSSITSTKQCSYSEITIQNGAELSNFIVYPQLELGSSVTSFVSHQEQNILIPCQEPMRSIGNVRDSFVKIDGVWYEKHNIGQVVLNGSEGEWVERGNTSENYIKFRNANALPYDIKGDLLLISDYFVTNIGANNASYSGNAICGNSGNYAKWLHISIDNTIVNSVETFKTWLSTHNTEVIYQLAEPIYLECTEEQTEALNSLSYLTLYDGVTHINSDANIEFRYVAEYETIDEEFLKDVKVNFRTEIWSCKFHCFK